MASYAMASSSTDAEFQLALDAMEASLLQSRLDDLGRNNAALSHLLQAEGRQPPPAPPPAAPPSQRPAEQEHESESMRALLSMHRELLDAMKDNKQIAAKEALWKNEASRHEFIAPPTPLQFSSGGLAATTSARLPHSSDLTDDDDDSPIVYGLYRPDEGPSQEQKDGAIAKLDNFMRTRNARRQRAIDIERARVRALDTAEPPAQAPSVASSTNEKVPRRLGLFGRKPKLQKATNAAPLPVVRLRRAGAQKSSPPGT